MLRLSVFAAALALLGAAPAVIVRPQTAGEAWNGSDVSKLHTDVDALLATDTSVRGAHVGVLALETKTGAQLYERNSEDEFQPASTLKLLVGSVALDRLGSAYRFSTRLERLGDRLVIRAGGDPLLVTSDFDAALQALRSAGLTSASGLTVDASRYATAPYPAGWVWDDFAYDYAAPVSAAALDGNTVTYSIMPADAVGEPVRIASGRSFVVPDKACPGIVDRATTAPANAAATIDTETLMPGCAAVTGSLPLGGARETVDIAVTNPVAHLEAAFIARLNGVGSGFTFGNGPGSGERTSGGSAGGGALTLWQHDSLPLGTWLGPALWIPSDNFVAEQLLCEVGYVASGAPGSTAGGLNVERTWLLTNGIDPLTTTLADGSGLSQYDRITPRALVAILQHDWNGPNRELVLDSLPVGGARGTIEGISGTPAAGRVFAKTGSMSHVRGLAGYLATARHGAVTFAFTVDDWNGDYAQLAALRARVLARIVTD